VIGALLTLSCGRQPGVFAAPPQGSLDLGPDPDGPHAFVYMDDLLVDDYLVNDISPERGLRRWAFTHPELRFRVKDVRHLIFAAEFAIPEVTYKVTGPVTVSCAVNGRTLGAILLARLRLTLYRWEAALFQFVPGAGCLSFLTAILCTMHIARKGVFQWGGLIAIVLALRQAKRAPRRRSLPAVPLTWMASFFLVFSAFFIYYFFNALSPEASPDGAGYHLGNVARMWRHHGFVWD